MVNVALLCIEPVRLLPGNLIDEWQIRNFIIYLHTLDIHFFLILPRTIEEYILTLYYSYYVYRLAFRPQGRPIPEPNV